ncbi:MAG: adenylate/guanylate cyclase domain-containing protein [Pseudomonadota bacterium]|nr:adenylate/guanylate cyclase domain-containing protein [Pseudomonadota bacterium]
MLADMRSLAGAKRLFADARTRAIADLYVWTMEAGLHGASAAELFDGYCRRVVEAGAALLRGHVSTQTLHPQWTGYGYTWKRRLNTVHEQQFARVETPTSAWLQSPFVHLIERARAGEPTPSMRRRLAHGPEQRDFPSLIEFHADGATDYYAIVYTFGLRGDPAHGAGVVLSFTSDAPDGFEPEQITLFEATLPGLALALKAHAGHDIASSLLRTYLGEDAGRRVHQGAVVRGANDSLRAVVWYADLKGFTAVSDAWPGPAVIDMLDDAFEALTAPLRARGGQVLKFIGDAMLATFAVDGEQEAMVCARALDAAEEALASLARDNERRALAGLPTVEADIALHLGEVLYGNVGAADRLDFTVIGPAVNEAARIERLCDALGRHILASERFALAAEQCGGRLAPLGRHALRGVAAAQTIYGLAPEARP